MAEESTFEDEILALNPEYDLVFGNYIKKSRPESPHALEPLTHCTPPQKMKIISKINEIVDLKPPGELPTENDWDDQQSAEKETIILMRKLGIEQSVDRPPDEKRTIATVPTNNNVIYMQNGRKKMSIFMADEYFELKPRSEPSFDLGDEGDPPETSTSEYSDNIIEYQPILESTQEPASTSLSEDQDEKFEPKVSYNPLSSESSVSDEPKSIKSSVSKKSVGKHKSCSRKERSPLNNSSTSRSSSKSWRSSSGSSFSDVRDENNWRLPASKNKITVESKEPRILNRTITLSKETPIDSSIQVAKKNNVSSCGTSLYNPKDLFMKKKAMMIQQVLAEHQS